MGAFVSGSTLGTHARSWAGTSCIFWRKTMNKYFDEQDVNFFKITAAVGVVVSLVTWLIV